MGVLFTVVVAASIGGPVIGGMLADRFGGLRMLVVTYLAGAAALTGGWLRRPRHPRPRRVRRRPRLHRITAPAGRVLRPHPPRERALGVRAFFAISFGIGSLWTAVIGWVVTAAGFPAAFAVMAGSFVAAAAVIVAFVRE